MEKSKKKRLPARKKISLELLHKRLGKRSTRSLLAGDTAYVWEDIEHRIDPDPFCTSCQIYSMKKKARSKNPLKPKSPFRWFLMDIVPSTAYIMCKYLVQVRQYLHMMLCLMQVVLVR